MTDGRLPANIHEKIQEYWSGIKGEQHHRYRSWEHCYRYFHSSTPEAIKADHDQAAMQLGFYLASWGMYRESSFLLQHAYTAHLGVIDQLCEDKFSALWMRELGSGNNDAELIPIIQDAIASIRQAYEPFTLVTKSGPATDTLVTKVLLGTLGCLPACDRYFIAGLKKANLKYSRLDAPCIERILQFCTDNLRELGYEQRAIERAGGLKYPLMKLMDMYFWQIGFATSSQKTHADLQLATTLYS